MPLSAPVQAVLGEVPVPGLTTAASETVRLPDGSLQTRSYSRPVNYQKSSGAWARIDTALVPVTGAASFVVRNAANAFDLRIPTNAALTPLRFTAEGSTIQMRMRGLGSLIPTILSDVAEFTQVLGADSVEYQSTPSGVKETIVLDQAPGSPVDYTYDLTLDPGMRADLVADGSIEFSRPSDTAASGREVVATMPPGQMEDSATSTPQDPQGPAYSADVFYDLRPAGLLTNRWVLKVTPSAAWLNDPARVYPVRIDPSLVSGSPNKDCWIASGNPDTGHCADANTNIRVGSYNGAPGVRGLLQFDISAIPGNANIDTASVNMYLNAPQSYSTRRADYELRRPGKSWGPLPSWNRTKPNGPVWTGGNPTGPAKGTLSLNGSEGGYQSFSTGVAGIVQGWVDNTSPADGFLLKQADETVQNVLWFVSSSVDNDFDKLPYLATTYTEPTDATDAGERSFWSYAERKLTDRMSAKVNIGNGNLLLTANDAKVAGVNGWDMALTRYYNSSARKEAGPGLGQGWSTAFGGSVRLSGSNVAGTGDMVTFHGPSGYQADFKKTNGSFARQGAGINADLRAENGGGYTLEWFDRSQYAFDSQGRLQYTQDSNKNRLTFNYTTLATGQERLSRVTDTRNRAAVMGYTAGLLTTVDIVDLKSAGTADDTQLLQWAYSYNQTPTGQSVLASSRLSAVNGTGIGAGTAANNDPSINVATTYEYDAQWHLTKVTDARENGDTNTDDGGVTTFTYDGDKVKTLTRRTDDNNLPDSTLTLDYIGDAFDDDVDPTDGENRDTCKQDDGDNLNGVEDVDAATRTIVDGERTDVEDETFYCVDLKARVLRVTDARGKQRSQSYTGNSNVQTADMTGTGAGLETYNYGYTNDSPSSSTTPDGAESGADYGDSTNPHSPTAVQGDDTGGSDNRWDYTYDDKNNLIVATGAQPFDGGTPLTRYRYCWSATGQIYRIDPATQTGALSNSTDPRRATRDANNNAYTDAQRCRADTSQGNDTLFTYNNRNELTGVNKPAGGDQSFTYDALSRIATVTDGRGVTTAYTYDGLDRAVKATHTKSGQTTQTVLWTYDLDGNTTGIDDGNGPNTMAYDELNRKSSETGQGPSASTDYAYDPVGNVVEISVAGEPSPTTYTYDDLNRVATVDDQRLGDQKITFAYDLHDKRKQTVFPVGANGGGDDIVQETRWNEDGNPKCIYSYRQTNAPTNTDNDCPSASFAGLITYYSYDYDKRDADGQSVFTSTTKWAMTELGGRYTTYDYDGIHRLTRATTRSFHNKNNDFFPILREFTYGYDRHSNLTQEKATGTTPGLETGTQWMTHNNGDEICASKRQATDPGLSCTTATAGQTSYAHDGAGNLTTATGGGTTTLDGLALTYNLPGQTQSIDPPGAIGAMPQAYDGVMQDRRTQNGPTTMSYGYAGLTSQNTTPGAGAPTAHRELFVRDPAGDLLAMIDNTTGAANGTTLYFLVDDQKSVMATIADTTPGAGTGPGGVVTATRYLYEPYGQTIRTWEDTNPATTNTQYTESTATPPATDYNPWRYASGYHDPHTGFLKFGTRYYIPQLGTWTQPDPKVGQPNNPFTINLYQYAYSDPGNNQDMSGRAVEDYVISCAVGAAQDALIGLAIGQSPASAAVGAIIGCAGNLVQTAFEEGGYDEIVGAISVYTGTETAVEITNAVFYAVRAV